MLHKVFLLFAIIVVIIVLFVIITMLANWMFNKNTTQEIANFFAGVTPEENTIISEHDLVGLPNCVQNWLKYSQIIGKEKIWSVRSKQNVALRTKPDQPWMPAFTESYYTIDKPGLLWRAKIQVAPLIHIAGRDKYYEGRGHMLIKLLSLIPVADARGKEIDQGTLVRYLAESVWYPTFALSEYIVWEEIDEYSAQATMTYKGTSGAGIFTFNELGEVISFEASRYMESNGKYSLETWWISMGDYRELNGINIPTKGKTVWKLDTGDFEWYRFEVVEFEYNTPEPY